jgi:hypothetical protein
VRVTAVSRYFAPIAPVIPDRRRIKTFAGEAAFERWLAVHHATEPEVWINIYKKSSGVASINAAQALDVALCWGWIDGIGRDSTNDRSCNGTRRAGGGAPGARSTAGTSLVWSPLIA